MLSHKEMPHKRTIVGFKNDQTQFQVLTKVFTQQYSGIYFTRLNILRPLVIEQANQIWGSPFVHGNPKLVERIIQVETNKICYIVGTLVVSQHLKPNILHQVTKKPWVVSPPKEVKYCSDSDSIILEDESGRLNLVGKCFDSEILTTGFIVGILGSEDQDGFFHVIDVCYPRIKPQSSITSSTNAWVAFVSGLNFGSAYSMDYELFLDYILGETGSEMDQDEARNIVRVVICGNSVAKPSDVELVKNKFGTDQVLYDPEPIQNFDHWVSSLCTGIEVDLVPGLQDPTSHLLPQQPINSSMFAAARRLSSFRCVTNPYTCEVDGTKILASSGEILNSLYQSVKSTERIQMVQQTLKAAHIAPLTPDTLWTFPFKDSDPFILEERPHIYVLGDQPSFETAVVNIGDDATRVVLIPNFSSAKTIALVNISTLEVVPIVFNATTIED